MEWENLLGNDFRLKAQQQKPVQKYLTFHEHLLTFLKAKNKDKGIIVSWFPTP